MIIIESIDLETSRAAVRTAEHLGDLAQPALSRTVARLRSLGISDVAVSGVRSGDTALVVRAIAATHPAAPDSAVATSHPSLTHRCTVVSEQTIYVATLPHLDTSLRIASGWVQCILATDTPPGHAVQQVHLGAYELVANLVDHGQPLKADARIEIGLRLEPGAISGWIADQCHAFDPRVALAHALRHRLDAHQPRGYGLYLVQQLFDSIDHHFGADGNRVEFRKDTRA